ncbi:reverse transcriptase domain, Reverse transcriptase zinc-binding domain protein [Artemisia annua]|uniref:Reverse transcriptase domain, Reverse transcriptase zinc-binding domain protein n=1 Tax=Artemisia annua TaxID=35608 RepID=A0A2U1MQW4_ARTAN|nr:reverse transcriptase domain, Reverse transcriptase zinc-binding domain protein [Artemisia annua]
MADLLPSSCTLIFGCIGQLSGTNNLVIVLCGRNFWDVPCRGNMYWSWRKILQIRPLVWQFFWNNIGNGLKASAWFDKWCSVGPLSLIVSSRDIRRAGFSSTSLVRDIIVEDA